MEALELFVAVRREAQGEPALGQLQPRIQELASQVGTGGAGTGPVVVAVHLPPQDVAHLPEGGRRAQHHCGIVAAEEPQDGRGGREALAQAVARLDGHPAVLPQRLQDLGLLAPEPGPSTSWANNAGEAQCSCRGS